MKRSMKLIKNSEKVKCFQCFKDEQDTCSELVAMWKSDLKEARRRRKQRRNSQIPEG